MELPVLMPDADCVRRGIFLVIQAQQVDCTVHAGAVSFFLSVLFSSDCRQDATSTSTCTSSLSSHAQTNRASNRCAPGVTHLDDGGTPMGVGKVLGGQADEAVQTLGQPYPSQGAVGHNRVLAGRQLACTSGSCLGWRCLTPRSGLGCCWLVLCSCGPSAGLHIRQLLGVEVHESQVGPGVLLIDFVSWRAVSCPVR